MHPPCFIFMGYIDGLSQCFIFAISHNPIKENVIFQIQLYSVRK